MVPEQSSQLADLLGALVAKLGGEDVARGMDEAIRTGLSTGNTQSGETDTASRQQYL